MSRRPEPEAYLLGELDHAQTADFERAMASDRGLHAEVERLRPVVAKLAALPAEAWADVEPPPLVMPAVAAAPARRRRRLVLRPLVAAACAVVLLGAGVALGTLLDRGPATRAVLALAPVGTLDPAAAGRVSLTRHDGVNVHVSGLKPTGDGEFYELWLLGADKRLVGLASFRVDGRGQATLRLPLPVNPSRFQYFDISLEPGDGDPGHSGLSVLRGSTRT